MSIDFKLTTIREDKNNKIERARFDFEGGWNYWGEELFMRIPCGNCGNKFTKEDISNENYDIWVNRKLSWIDYEPNLWWDRGLIEYKVNDLTPAKRKYEPDSKNQHYDFADVRGKDLILKANFVITNLTHKKDCVKDK